MVSSAHYPTYFHTLKPLDQILDIQERSLLRCFIQPISSVVLLQIIVLLYISHTFYKEKYQNPNINAIKNFTPNHQFKIKSVRLSVVLYRLSLSFYSYRAQYYKWKYHIYLFSHTKTPWSNFGYTRKEPFKVFHPTYFISGLITDHCIIIYITHLLQGKISESKY